MTPEEIVDELMHWGPYDPAKAHEYYLQNRQLKGRNLGPQNVTGKIQGSGSQKSPVALRKEAEAKVAQIKSRLAHLQTILARLQQEAQKQSAATSKASKANQPHPKVQKHLTPQQKQKQKLNRQHPKQHPAKKPVHSPTGQQLNARIHQVELKIHVIRLLLTKAIEDARKKAAA